MRHVAFLEDRERFRSTAFGSDAHEASIDVRRKHNRLGLDPTGAAVVRSLAHDQRSASTDRHALQLVVGKESQPLAIRREEDVLRLLRALEDRGVRLVETSRCEATSAIDPSSQVCESLSIG